MLPLVTAVVVGFKVVAEVASASMDIVEVWLGDKGREANDSGSSPAPHAVVVVVLFCLEILLSIGLIETGVDRIFRIL